MIEGVGLVNALGCGDKVIPEHGLVQPRRSPKTVKMMSERPGQVPE
jgi:hypothetical protein